MIKYISQILKGKFEWSFKRISILLIILL